MSLLLLHLLSVHTLPAILTAQPLFPFLPPCSYLHIVTPALLLYSIHDCIDRYLISQDIVKPSLVVASVCSALTPILSWYFVSHLDLGLEGAGYAYTSVQASQSSDLCHIIKSEMWTE